MGRTIDVEPDMEAYNRGDDPWHGGPDNEYNDNGVIDQQAAHGNFMKRMSLAAKRYGFVSSVSDD